MSGKYGLLIVDLQKGFSPSSSLVKKIEEVMNRFDAVVMTRFVNEPDSLFREKLNWHNDGGELSLPTEGVVVLDKSGYGLTAEHIETIKELECLEWHVVGLETDACVMACAFSLWDAGIAPNVHLELCEGLLHHKSVPIIERQFGRHPRPLP